MLTPSPCNNVCTIERRTGWCRGCGRNLSEIADWALASEAQRAAIVAALPARLAQLQPRRSMA